MDWDERTPTPVVKLREAAAVLKVGARTAEGLLRRAGLCSGYVLSDVEYVRDHRTGQGARTDLYGLTPTVVFQGYEGGKAVGSLDAELTAIDPKLTAPQDKNRAVLLVVPRATGFYVNDDEQATADHSYDLHWAHEAVAEKTAWPDTDLILTTTYVPVQHVGALPEAPRHTDADAGMPARRGLDAYDWSALAQILAATVHELGRPPKLTAGQRAQVAAAELLRAQRRLGDAQTSLTAHLWQAAQAGEPVDLPAGYPATLRTRTPDEDVHPGLAR